MSFSITYTDKPENVVFVPSADRNAIYLVDELLISKNIGQVYHPYYTEIPLIYGGSMHTNTVFPVSIDLFTGHNIYLWFGDSSICVGRSFFIYPIYDNNFKQQEIKLNSRCQYMVIARTK